jgi:hypothetical protein
VNATTRRLSLRTSVGDRTDPFDRGTERLHLDGDTAYRPCPRPAFGTYETVSYAVDLPRNRSWRSYTVLGYFAAATDAATLYDEGVETVDGRRAREVRVVLNPARTGELAARTAPLRDEDDADPDRVSPLTDPGATEIRAWFATESGLPLRFRVSVERSRLLGADVVARATYDVTYGPTSVSLPGRTVPSEDACPSP